MIYVLSLFADSCAPPLSLGAPDGRLRGYARARRGTSATYLGLLVASDKQAATALLDRMLNQLSGDRVDLDFHTGFGPLSSPLSLRLVERGLIKQRDLIRNALW